MLARAHANLPLRVTPFVVTDATSTFAATQSVSAALDEAVTVGGTVYRATTRSSHTRTVSSAAGVVTITGSGSQEPALSGHNPSAVRSASTFADTVQTTCFAVTGNFLATVSAQTNSPVARRLGSDAPVGAVLIDGPFVQPQTLFVAPASSSTFVGGEGGEACISFFPEPRRCATTNVGVSCFTPNPLTWTYTVTLTPAPLPTPRP